jgi:uncharacterized phosphatase
VSYAFIRHGQTDWNRDDRLQGSSDIPLNDTGRAQALEAAAVLAGTPWRAIVSSPLKRARETAEIIAAELSIDLGPSYDELVERDYGPLEGQDSSETMERWPNRDYPGAEPLDSVVERGKAGLERIAADYGDQDVVIVCHGTIIRYTLAALADRPVDGIQNGSVSTFRLERDPAGEQHWDVQTVNGSPLIAVAEPEAP